MVDRSRLPGASQNLLGPTIYIKKPKVKSGHPTVPWAVYGAVLRDRMKAEVAAKTLRQEAINLSEWAKKHKPAPVGGKVTTGTHYAAVTIRNRMTARLGGSKGYKAWLNFYELKNQGIDVSPPALSSNPSRLSSNFSEPDLV